ncbi:MULTISPECIES: nucleotidyltransferase domain-containing protein [unclassified Leucobacter]|uniref:nucleotidyltransferase domain-containing protein n=1 Tax=unclassified Leucobacter TaxID=2621730 RepID=UPI00165DE30B|nr:MULTISPECIES: nucleotidyltransferase domain-containing protein [unclassified Leucobacter]MBC9927130.1 nucleotidyltransferase domain-containing protein [Leucobacter sp. cx-169]
MRLQNPFAAVSTTGLDSQVLTVLARVEQYLSIQQIHQLLPEHGSPQGIRKSVARLAAQGVLLERSVGRSIAYALNQDHLLAEIILRIAGIKSELISRIRQDISVWQVQPLTAKIFGSAARNDMHDDSDIDILVIMPDAATEESVEEAVGQLAARVTLWTGNDVRPLVYRSSEVRPASIFDSILAEGIDLAGDPSWLRKQLRKEVAHA